MVPLPFSSSFQQTFLPLLSPPAIAVYLMVWTWLNKLYAQSCATFA
uniref:Uncharacterized protein n=1 Tax=Rhizophora mucronata TaxID=61149 RepID=A0A2P2IN64_RHIMU